jgi:hypothetical protein
MLEEILKTVRQKIEINFNKEFYSEAEYASVIKKLNKSLDICASTYLEWLESKDQRIAEFTVNLKLKEVQVLFNENPEKFNQMVKEKDAKVGQWKLMNFKDFLNKFGMDIKPSIKDDNEAAWFSKLMNEIPNTIKDAGNYMLKNHNWKDHKDKFYENFNKEFSAPRKQLANLYENTKEYLSYEEFTGEEQIIINTGHQEVHEYSPFKSNGDGNCIIASNPNYHYTKKVKNITVNFLYLFIISKEKILRFLIDSKGLVERSNNSNFLDLKRILMLHEQRLDIYYWNTDFIDSILMDSYKDTVKLQNKLNQFRIEARFNNPRN